MSALRIRWPKYWSFSFSISPSNEYSGLIPFRVDWFDPLERVSKGLSSLLQCHSLKTSVLWYSAFFMVEFSHPYLTTGKTMALTIQTSVGKVMFLQVRNPVWCNWILFSACGLTRLKSRYQLGLQFSPGAQGPLPNSLVVGQTHFLLMLSTWTLHLQASNGSWVILML